MSAPPISLRTPGPAPTYVVSSFGRTMALKQKKWAHAHSVLHLGFESKIIARCLGQGASEEIVAARPHDGDVGKISGLEARRVAVGQKDRGIDVRRVGREAACQDELMIRGRAVDHYPRPLADARPLPPGHQPLL